MLGDRQAPEVHGLHLALGLHAALPLAVRELEVRLDM
jgi:hypothetical protein